MRAAVRSTLAQVAAMLAEEQDAWWIIGSAAAALHGVDTDVADVDLLTSAAAARRIAWRLGIDPISRPSDRFRSAIFLSLQGLPLPVEVMGDLSLAADEGWEPVQPVTRVKIGALHVPARDELVTILRRFGRDKDLARAAALGG